MEAALKERQQEILAGLYDKYELLPTDFFEHKHYKIIKREGIEKIIDVEGITFDLEPWYVDEVCCVIKGTYRLGDDVVITTGSANRGNSQSHYFAEMAEKRCNSRGVLKLIKAYKFGIMGEDEMDDRDESYQKSRRQASPSSTGAVFKGQR